MLNPRQIEKIRNEFSRRKALLQKRLTAIEQKKLSRRNTTGYKKKSESNTTVSGTRVKTRSGRVNTKRVSRPMEREEIIRAAKMLGANSDMLKQLGVIE